MVHILLNKGFFDWGYFEGGPSNIDDDIKIENTTKYCKIN